MSFFIHLFLMTKYPFNSDMLALGKKFNEAGFSLYLVGGAVRDFLLKKENDDADFTTDATPDEVIKLFPKATIPTGIKHGTVTVIFNKQSYEITTFRTEGKYSDSRHPDNISFVRSLEEDLSRRDFTVNAFAASTKDGAIIDLHNGLEDLNNKVIRAIGCAKQRFDEDALRMLRAIRFASKLGFKIEDSTFDAIKKDSSRITIISKERIREEIFKIIDSPNPSYGFKLLRESGLLKYIIPCLDQAYGFEQLGNHKEDVFFHTLSALEAAKSLGYPFIVKLAILFHDLGKIEARRGSAQEGYTFYGHELISANIARKNLTELKCSNEEIERTTNLVKNHMFSYTPNWTDSAVRRFILRVGINDIPYLFDLRKADALSMDEKADFTLLNEFENRIQKELETQNALTLKDLKLNGNDIKSLFNVQGKTIGNVLSYLLEEVIEDPSLNDRDKLINLTKLFLSKLS